MKETYLNNKGQKAGENCLVGFFSGRNIIPLEKNTKKAEIVKATNDFTTELGMNQKCTRRVSHSQFRIIWLISQIDFFFIIITISSFLLFQNEIYELENR